MYRLFWHSLAIQAALVLASGCTVLVDHERDQCEATPDCLALGEEFQNARCIAGYCRNNACTSVDDCNAGEACIANLCVPGCRTPDDCQVGQLCEDSQCSGEPDPAWSCLGNEPPADEFPGESRTLTLPISSISQRESYQVDATLCPGADLTCSQGTPMSSENSQFSVTLTDTANWYLRITPMSPNGEEYLPLDYVFPNYLVDGATLPSVLLTETAAADALVEQQGDLETEAGRGQLFVSIIDCNGELAGGIELTTSRVDDRTALIYTSGVYMELEETQDGNGRGAFINHEAGTTAVDFTLRRTGQHLATYSTVVRADRQTAVTYYAPRSEDATADDASDADTDASSTANENE